MDKIRREDICIGFITGECRNNEKNKGCGDFDKRDCYMPVCKERTQLVGSKCYCKATGTEVDMWDVCRHCNPKENL